MGISTAVPLPMDHVCPGKCPFSQTLDGIACKKLCITGDQCHEFHPVRFFPDHDTMTCEPSCGREASQRVAGCESCAGPGVCRRCARGLFGLTSLMLNDDGTECVNMSRVWWQLGYGMVAVVAIGVLLYAVQLAFREPVGENVLQDALKSRDEARRELRPLDPEKYTLKSVICINPHRLSNSELLGGRGVTLYFNWLLFGILVAFILMCASFYAFELSDLQRKMHAEADCSNAALGGVTFSASEHRHGRHLRLLASRGASGTEGGADVETASSDLIDALDAQVDKLAKVIRQVSPIQAEPTGDLQRGYTQYYERMFFTATVAYALVTSLTLAFSYWQLRYVAKADAPTAGGFTALVSGLPRDVVDGSLVTDHCQKALDAQFGPARHTVIGTSIAYDYNQYQSLIRREAQKWLDQIDDFRDKKPDFVVKTRRKEIHEALQVDTFEPASFFDKALMNVVGLEEEREMVITGSTLAFVVCETREARDALVRLHRDKVGIPFKHVRHATKHTPAWTFMKDRALGTAAGAQQETQYSLSAAEAPSEPLGVKWENFSGWGNFWHKILLGQVLILGTIFMWMCLYVPYALYYADLVVIPGVEPTMFQDVILGLLIAVGNGILAIVIEKVTDWAGFYFKDRRDRTVLGLGFVCTMVNTLADLAMVAVVARGVMLENAFHGKNSSYDNVVAHEIYKLIVPGYLILPYLGQPIVTHLVPYYLAKFLVRAHARIARESANSALQCPMFEMCWRYSDILNNTTLCIVLLFFTSGVAWKVMAWLILFLILIYMIDKFMMFNYTTTTVYDSDLLGCAFSKWCVVPTGLLAALVAFWGYKANAIVSTWTLAAIPMSHVVVFLVVINIIEKKAKTTPSQEILQVRYSELAASHHVERWDYHNTTPSFFNTNLVFCLRTRFADVALSQNDLVHWREIAGHIYEGEASKVELCVPFVRGNLQTLKIDKARPCWGKWEADAS